MVLHLCLSDSCEENEKSSSHCIKLLIINSSLEICKLRHCTYWYRRLVWVKAEIFKSAPFSPSDFQRTPVLRSLRVCLQWWVQRTKVQGETVTSATAGEQVWNLPYTLWAVLLLQGIGKSTQGSRVAVWQLGLIPCDWRLLLTPRHSTAWPFPCTAPSWDFLNEGKVGQSCCFEEHLRHGVWGLLQRNKLNRKGKYFISSDGGELEASKMSVGCGVSAPAL